VSDIAFNLSLGICFCYMFIYFLSELSFICILICLHEICFLLYAMYFVYETIESLSFSLTCVSGHMSICYH
jgi:hypothetical protein